MSAPQEKLRRLLGDPALAPLRRRLRRHFERRDDEKAQRFLSLSQLEEAEREALAQLTGRRTSRARSLRLDMTQVDAALREAGICDSLREALEWLDGPITNRVAARNAARRAWASLAEHESRDIRLQAWLQAPGALGLLRRLSRQDPAVADSLLMQADTVLRRLPAAGLPRAQLAAQTLGDAHALDTGRPVATIVLAAWRHDDAAASVESISSAAEEARWESGPQTEETPRRTSDQGAEQALAPALIAQESLRETWARAGVLVNELARPALFLNLPVSRPATPTWTQGEPSYLSLRQLLRAPPPWSVAGAPVFVCENPNMLAIAADQLGAHCAPLVCTDGMPAAAQRTMLNQLRQAGAVLHYHGDFDWPGLHIANHVMRTWRATPWRLSINDYMAAVRAASHTRPNLNKSEVVADWDSLLAPAMTKHGLAIAEEAVAETLLDDLDKVSATCSFSQALTAASGPTLEGGRRSRR